MTVGALKSIKTIQNVGGTVDAKKFSNLATINYTRSGIYLKVVLVFVLCCWLFSVLDAYKMGKKSLLKENGE